MQTQTIDQATIAAARATLLRLLDDDEKNVVVWVLDSAHSAPGKQVAVDCVSVSAPVLRAMIFGGGA